MNITTIREKYPQYSDLSDKQLVDAIHKKFYKDIPIKKFYETVGLTQPQSLPKHVNLKPKQNADITKNSTEIVVNPSKQSIEQPQSDFLFYLLVVVVGLLVWFFKTSSNKRSESNEHQKILETEFSRAKEFEKQTRLDAELIKIDAAKLTALQAELNQTRSELEKRARLDTERIKADIAKQIALEVELNNARTELERRVRLDNERIKIDAAKQTTLEAEIHKSKSFEKQARSEVDLNRLAKLEAELATAERIKIDAAKLTALQAELNQVRSELENRARLDSEDIKADNNRSIRKYILGDIGPYGGIVFSINDTGNAGIEAKSTDEILRLNWNKSIIATSQHGNDWCLPTKNELDLLYKQKETVGGFTNADYWCSTEYNTKRDSLLYPKSSDAWIQSFNTGYQYVDNKNLNLNVRAIRSFDYSEEKNTTSINVGKQYTNDGTRSTVVIIKDENTGKFEDMF